jgi:hypothetical protein
MNFAWRGSRIPCRPVQDKDSYCARLGSALTNLQALVLKRFCCNMRLFRQVVWGNLCRVINDKLNSQFMQILAIFTILHLSVFCSIYPHQCTLTLPVFAAPNPFLGSRMCKSPASSFAVNFSISTSSGKVKWRLNGPSLLSPTSSTGSCG